MHFLTGLVIVCLVFVSIALLSMVHLSGRLSEIECRLDRHKCQIQDLQRCCTELCDVVNGANDGGGLCQGRPPIKAPRA